jgi:hypothetical protein
MSDNNTDSNNYFLLYHGAMANFDKAQDEYRALWHLTLRLLDVAEGALGRDSESLSRISTDFDKMPSPYTRSVGK